MASASAASLTLAALVFVSALPLQQAIKVIDVSKDHPVEGVIDLLKKLEGMAEKNGKDEEELYAKFEYWCQNSVKTLEKAIVEEKATMEKFVSDIDSNEKNIDVLTKQIGALGDKLSELDAGGIAADNERNASAGLYNEAQTSLIETISAIQKAIDVLERAKSNTSVFLLAQRQVRVVVALVSYKATQIQTKELEDFSEVSADSALARAPADRPELKAEGNYEAHIQKYGFKSQSVIELLKKLKLQFEDDHVAATKAETNAINAYNLAKQARGEVKTATDNAKSAKEGELNGAKLALSDAQLNYNNTRADLEADSATLDTTQKSCEQRAAEWQERSSIRTKEREAIETAISILAKVTGVRTEAPGNPVPPTSPVSLLQLSSPRAERAVTLLRAEARAEHSKALEQIAVAVEKHGDGPFDQIVNMIQKMIFRLMHEQTEEDEHKDWCDQALSKTNASIVDKEGKIEELGAKIDDAVAQAQELLIDVQAADDMVGKITAHMKEATEIRQIGKRENALAIKDAEDAQTALANAIAVLKDHYKESGEVPKESWEFLQARREPVTLPEDPSTWSASYTAVADPVKQPGGILTLLMEVSADFAQMESDTAAQEASDKEIYDEDMKNCDVERARRTKESQVKSQERQRQLEKQKNYELERKGVASQLEATEQYLKDLQPACVTGDSTYVDRKAARAKEVEALKEAQGLLQNAFAANATADGGSGGAEEAEPEPESAGFLGRRAAHAA
mmetsp:Transcript_84341/g.219522  ORF Transcript_84341/g.219522 Transcript_84341/m.219522 type:complete len:740 (+) Transcript_84341:43-2262(+)